MLVFSNGPILADDTCVFMSDEEEMAPNIIWLLDNGGEMQNVVYIGSFDNDKDYTPVKDASLQVDVTEDLENGNGFYSPNGYIIRANGYQLVPVGSDLEMESCCNAKKGDAFIEPTNTSTSKQTATFKINNNTITLPAQPFSKEVNGVIDGAEQYRYPTNYLNWIFFSGEYKGNGNDLIHRSRFWYAKQALLLVGKLTANRANFGVFNYVSTTKGASSVQPLKQVVDTVKPNPILNVLSSDYVNNINNMGTVTYSPMAEGLASIGGFFGGSNSGLDPELYCVKNFVIMVSPGISSMDQDTPSDYFQNNSAAVSEWANYGTKDIDGDGATISEGKIKTTTTSGGVSTSKTYSIPTNINGSTYADDVAYFMNQHDMVDYVKGSQKMITYTIGFMASHESNLFLTNISNNGNGNLNLYETTDPEYGKYHFEAKNPNDLVKAMMEAINSILSRKNTFTAPVVPVTRTTSGNRIYMAFFKPSESLFWEGNVTKFGISTDLNIVDKNGNSATYPNGSIKDDAEAYWETKNWATPGESNYMHNSTRNIYTYLGGSKDLTDSSNAFKTSNSSLTKILLGTPTNPYTDIIEYVRGADVFDENGDGDTTDNRELITGDVLHSEPLVVRYSSKSVIYFGSNDGMLHAVDDDNGKELWGFIPPDMLHRIKDMVEADVHQYYVDGSPKVFLVDNNSDGEVGAGDKAYLVCGYRKGGKSYFAIDITTPSSPKMLWMMSGSSVTSPVSPDVTHSKLGETWSDPTFGTVMDGSTAKDVVFLGGGYSSDNSLGDAVIVANVKTGYIVKEFTSNMDYSFTAPAYPIDANGDGYIEKVYIGDLGGQMWRFGNFSGAFPNHDKNIGAWTGEILFKAPTGQKFYYPPAVTLESPDGDETNGFDLVFMGTGDREDPCNQSTSDGLYVVKDVHQNSPEFTTADLVNVTTAPSTPVDLTDSSIEGWYISLAAGEKALAKGIVFNKVYYITTFTPGTDPCVPGGSSTLYALSYLSGDAVIDFDGDGAADRTTDIGGGIASKPVLVLTDEGTKLLISVGSTTPDANSPTTEAGIMVIDPVSMDRNFFNLWWREMF
jgi:type IV pilus assembly protein PilY1